MDEREIKKRCLNLMAHAELVYLSSVNELGYPEIRAMTNLRNDGQFARLRGFFNALQDDFLVFLTTNRPSDKVVQIMRHSKVCLYYSSFPEVHGLMLGGTIEIVDDSTIRHMLWEESWRQFYYDGVDGTEYTVLKFRPEFGKGWYKNHGKFHLMFNS